MGDQRPTFRAWTRFRLRTLVLVVAIAAVLFVSSRSLYVWYTTTTLTSSVAAFNLAAESDPIGKYEPPLSAEEVVSSIKRQLPTLNASDGVKEIYARIARTRRLPMEASFDSTNSFAEGREGYRAWAVSLEVKTGPDSGYSLNIRRTDNPVAGASPLLSLQGMKISGQELPALLEGHADVRILDLGHNPLSDEALANLHALKKLEIVHLEHTGITDEGLLQLRPMTNLKEVHLYRGPGHRTTKDGRRALQEAIPGLKMPFITH